VQKGKKRAHQAKKRSPESVPEIRAPIIVATVCLLQAISWLVHLTFQSSQKMLGRLLVASNIQARNGEIVGGASESRSKVESATVGEDGVLRLSTVC